MKRQTESNMRKLYQEWLSSGVSRSEFSDMHGIVRTTFYYWTKKFSTQEEETNNGKAFQLLDTIPSVGREGRVIAHIHYPSGISLEIYDGVSPEFIKTLLV
ncbi:IS66 family insertion sequence element accessory protein TnpA [Cyclobacterium marinum]|uniref:Transposase n=1 Tax=Cyclobacterium marinum (strain ATCC 25205 / DSM 745 / LMG 13164 / NCIMB 1802) TaxID=880070 RepID=G0IXH3_CYCMS|nr:hypothetical protein [Cyclobacterium marinum]AEL25316.1 hypothetical protein Cycma_1559 [Cyclobacterium marinum DSM 745]AEL27162.1 hypothetical protein Cycma_3439 [Cyclobacterium marinum DSM 745]MBR9776312.1 hypothetical protein [Cytophagales bacterium]|tara:strand:- start:1128 stop:1430 length:303 start_codon:yes stop_codon:yes gene_type:complete